MENWGTFVSMSRTGVRSHEFQSLMTPVVRCPVATTLTATPSGDVENVTASIGGSQRRLETRFPLMVKRESVEKFSSTSTGWETTAKSPDVRLTDTCLAGSSTCSQCYESFFSSSLTMRPNKLVFVPHKLFQPSIA